MELYLIVAVVMVNVIQMIFTILLLFFKKKKRINKNKNKKQKRREKRKEKKKKSKKAKKTSCLASAETQLNRKISLVSPVETSSKIFFSFGKSGKSLNAALVNQKTCFTFNLCLLDNKEAVFGTEIIIISLKKKAIFFPPFISDVWVISLIKRRSLFTFRPTTDASTPDPFQVKRLATWITSKKSFGFFMKKLDQRKKGKRNKE